MRKMSKEEFVKRVMQDKYKNRMRKQEVDNYIVEHIMKNTYKTIKKNLSFSKY